MTSTAEPWCFPGRLFVKAANQRMRLIFWPAPKTETGDSQCVAVHVLVGGQIVNALLICDALHSKRLARRSGQ